jgi:hypothetical protein
MIFRSKTVLGTLALALLCACSPSTPLGDNYYPLSVLGVFGRPNFVLNHRGLKWVLIQAGEDKTEVFGLTVDDSQLKLEGMLTVNLGTPGPLALPAHFILRRNGPILCGECSGASSIWLGPLQP